MENSSIPFIQVTNLSITFLSQGFPRKVVDSISFNLLKGMTLGLVGESGSGKSVTAMSILGLLGSNTELQGTILFEEHNLVNLSNHDFRAIRGSKISMIFQEPMTSLNPVYSCGEQVAEVLKTHLKLKSMAAKQESIRLFKEVELPRPAEIFDSYPHQLSGGQRQRVMIAMALATNPEVLIADEPTTALDVTVQKTIVDLLIRLKRTRNMSMIFISHDLGLVHQIADEVLVMYQGQIVERGLTDTIFNNPSHPYTRGLLASRPIENQGLYKLPMMSDFMKTDANGQILAQTESIAEVRSRLTNHPMTVNRRKDLIYSQQPLLTIEHLSKQYKSVKAVNDVSFKIFPGETLGLVGESGCGKSTLGRSILRLIEPDQGRIFYRNENILHLSKRELRDMRKKMQLVFQDPYSSLNPKQTIGETILEPLQIFKLYTNDTLRKKKVLELLEKVQLLPEYYGRYPHEFSGGQRQRIGIARSLSLSPEFMVCDESVSALDVSIQAQIINLLISLRDEFKLTLLFISHDLSVIRFISDRILVMNQGKIEEEGSPDDIYFNPTSAYTKRLIDAIPKPTLPNNALKN